MLIEFYGVEREGYSWLASGTPFTTPKQVEIAYGALSGEQRELFERICRRLPSAEQYVRDRSAEYGWDEDLIAEAKVFTPKPLATPVPYFDPPWHCFENSFSHAEQHNLLYVEGIAINPSGPQIHAWNSTDGTDVLDYTWPYQHVNHYFGIVFPLEWMKKNWPARGGILAHLYEEAKAGKTPAPV